MKLDGSRVEKKVVSSEGKYRKKTFTGYNSNDSK